GETPIATPSGWIDWKSATSSFHHGTEARHQGQSTVKTSTRAWLVLGESNTEVQLGNSVSPRVGGSDSACEIAARPSTRQETLDRKIRAAISRNQVAQPRFTLLILQDAVGGQCWPLGGGECQEVGSGSG